MSSKPSAQQKEQTARVHVGQSNRRTKDRGESKTVFKSVLANPFEVKWPTISQETQNAVLERLVELLRDVAEYNLKRQSRSREFRSAAIRRRRKKGRTTTRPTQKAVDIDSTQKSAEDDPSASTLAPPASAPEILQHLTVGINAVTKQLEQQCCTHRQIFSLHSETHLHPNPISAKSSGDKVGNEEIVMNDTTTTGVAVSVPGAGASASSSSSKSNNNSAIPRPPIRSVLLCRADIDPPLLVAHIPYLVAACNNSSSSTSSRATFDPKARIKLFSLPKGAEAQLSHAMGLRRVSVLGLDETVSKDEILVSLLSSVDTVVAPWLVGLGVANSPVRSASNLNNNTHHPNPPKHTQLLRRRLEPTHIKQLRTTAPKDMRAAKALRAKARAQAKAKRKLKTAAKKPARLH